MMQRGNSVPFIELGDVVSKSERYTEKGKFDKRVRDEIEAHGGEYTANAERTAYSFSADNVERLIVLHDGSIYKTDCFIDYEWLPEMTFNEFKALYKVFVSTGFSQAESPNKSLHGPKDATKKTYRAVFGVKGLASTVMYKGVIVNPPYPLTLGPTRGASRLGLLATVAVVAGIGLMIRELLSED